LGAEDSKGDRSEKDSGVIMLTNCPNKLEILEKKVVQIGRGT